MAISNTTKVVEQNPWDGLVMGLPGMIEASEARGQRELVASESLPTDAGGDDAKFVALGFTFGTPDENDALFRTATLPAGWTKRATDHSMWSEIVDERGIRRVAIFYKAAYYDRAAHMHLTNVGREVASDARYGETLPTATSLRLDRLTPDEIGEFRASLAEQRADIERSPSIYGKYEQNLKACEAVLASACRGDDR